MKNLELLFGLATGAIKFHDNGKYYQGMKFQLIQRLQNISKANFDTRLMNPTAIAEFIKKRIEIIIAADGYYELNQVADDISYLEEYSLEELPII